MRKIISYVISGLCLVGTIISMIFLLAGTSHRPEYPDYPDPYPTETKPTESTVKPTDNKKDKVVSFLNHINLSNINNTRLNKTYNGFNLYNHDMSSFRADTTRKSGTNAYNIDTNLRKQSYFEKEGNYLYKIDQHDKTKVSQFRWDMFARAVNSEVPLMSSFSLTSLFNHLLNEFNKDFAISTNTVNLESLLSSLNVSNNEISESYSGYRISHDGLCNILYNMNTASNDDNISRSEISAYINEGDMKVDLAFDERINKVIISYSGFDKEYNITLRLSYSYNELSRIELDGNYTKDGATASFNDNYISSDGMNLYYTYNKNTSSNLSKEKKLQFTLTADSLNYYNSYYFNDYYGDRNESRLKELNITMDSSKSLDTYSFKEEGYFSGVDTYGNSMELYKELTSSGNSYNNFYYDSSDSVYSDVSNIILKLS